jgi:type I restriction enzyme S subunit
MWQGSLGISEYDGIVSPAYIVCDLFTNANLNYLQFLLRSPLLKSFYNQVSYGIRVGQWDMHYDDFKSLCLYLPLRSEQDQIVRYLDWKVSIINKYINAKKKQIELLKEYFSKKVTDLLVNNTNSHIKMKHLTEYKLQYGANASGVDYTDKYPRYIRITDINNDSSLRNDNVLSLDLLNYNDYLLKDGDILFARSGATVGKSFIYKNEYGKCCFAGYLIRIIPNKEIIIPEYLYYFTLSSGYLEWLKQVFIQTTIPNISAEKYKELNIPYTPLEEQTKLVSKIQSELENNEIIIRNIEHKIRILQEYRTCLISDIVTGKVDVQGEKVPEFETDIENTNIPDANEEAEITVSNG